MKKNAFVINGAGGVGKDTLIDEFISRSGLLTLNVSAVDIIKDIARKYGGWNGEKDLKSRKFISDLKNVFIEYNNLPTKHLLERYEDFLHDEEHDVMFVHIREPKEIEKFVKGTNGKVVTILIKRQGISDQHYGNHSDDDVANYNYDIVFDNDKSIEESSDLFTNMICSFLK